MSAESYFMGWLVYLLALVGFLALGWYISRGWPPWLRHPVRALVAVLLLFPWSVAAGEDNLAPAWIVALFDGLMQRDAEAARAGIPLLVAVLVGTAAAGFEQWWRKRKSEATA